MRRDKPSHGYGCEAPASCQLNIRGGDGENVLEGGREGGRERERIVVSEQLENKEMYRHIDRLTETPTDRQTDRQNDGQMDRQTQTDRKTDKTYAYFWQHFAECLVMMLLQQIRKLLHRVDLLYILTSTEGEREKGSECVCVCVCVRERDREREKEREDLSSRLALSMGERLSSTINLSISSGDCSG